jgi:hypothetical protein
MKNRGPTIDPCGIPLCVLLKDDLVLTIVWLSWCSIPTYWRRSVSYFLIQSSALCLIFSCLSLVIKIFQSSVSKAFYKSRNRPEALFLSSHTLVMSLQSLAMAVVVLYFLLNPCWLIVIRLLASRYSVS